MTETKLIELVKTSGLDSISDRELYARYDDMLDECQADIEIGCLSYTASSVLKAVDPTAYRCGFSDWLDSECSDDRLAEINGEYYDYDSVNELIEGVN